MAPEALHDDLVYVSNVANNTVTAYGFLSHKLVGRLTGINAPYGMCSDTSGNVWVVAWGNNKLIEYAHAGTKPLKILSVNDPKADLYDCSVDPTTGNLAVTNWGWYNWYQGSVFIFTNATGKPKAYTGPGLWFYYSCSYDDNGNLYVDGLDSYIGVFALGVLPKGGSSFRAFNLPPSFTPIIIGAARWDGQYVAVGDWNAVYTFNIHGNDATIQGYVPLTKYGALKFFWIPRAPGSKYVRGRSIIAVADAHSGTAQGWKYPQGGKPAYSIGQGLDWPYGITVSLAQP